MSAVRGTRAGRLALGALLAFVALLLLARPALADTTTVDFDSSPPPLGTAINDDYKASNFVFWQRDDPGFRPYRRAVTAGVETVSGTTFADFSSRCYPEEVDDASQCEFSTPSTRIQLTRTATRVTLYAGLYDPLATQPTSATMTAYRADGSVADTDTETVGLGMTTKVEVTSGAPNIADIAYVDLTADGDGAIGAPMGFDDLTLEYPTNSLPEVALSGPLNTVAVLEGQTTHVPLAINRLNGSSGDLHFSVTGLPSGVTGSVTPDPLTGTATTATLDLTAATGVSRVDLDQFTVTADPKGDANVAPGPRTVNLNLRVNTNFELAGGGGMALPPCAPVDRTITLQRDSTYTGTTTLSLDPPPSGVSAQILGGTVIPPGGDFFQNRTLRVSRGPGNIAAGAAVTVRATAPGYPGRALTIPLSQLGPSGTVSPTTGVTPMRLQAGTKVTVSGNGFCPGTQVTVGSSQATDVTLADDGRSFTFDMPRTATSGDVRVVPPFPGSAFTAGSMTVTNFRGTNGMQFANYGWGSLSYDELTSLVGSDEMFITFNPCWPWSSCRVNTGVPDPLAYAVWGVLKIVVKESGGHCFGISRTIQELLAHKVAYSQFSDTATNPHQLGRADGPGTAFGSFIDSRHAGQGTAEFLHHYLESSDSIAVQVEAARHELAAGRYPGISIRNGLTEGHVVTLYDIERQADGSFKLFVYDNNRPQTPAEEGSTSDHADAEVTQGVIDINAAGDRWTFHQVGGDVWSGGNDGSLYTIPLSDIPDDPSLPGLADLDLIVDLFGSTGGAAVTDGQSNGAKLLPVLDPHGRPGAAGFVVAHRKLGTLSHTMRGVKAGSYTEFVAGPHFAGGVAAVKTAKGVIDHVAGTPKAGALSFAGGMKRKLALTLAVDKGSTHRSAQVATTAGKGGKDTAVLGGGVALSYAHAGPATKARITLTSVAVNGGPVVFRSPKLSVARGAKLTLKPLSWKTLDRVRVTTKRKGHRATSRVVRNTAKFAGRVRLAKPSLGRGRRAGVAVRFLALPHSPVAGVVLRVMRGKKVVARKAVALAKLRRGRRTVTWRVPKKVKAGRYRLVANVLLAGGGATPGRRTATSARSIRIR